MLKNIIYNTSYNGFGVCERLSRFLGVSVNKIRLIFLYGFFFTIGTFSFVYFLVAILAALKDLFFYRRKSVFDL